MNIDYTLHKKLKNIKIRGSLYSDDHSVADWDKRKTAIMYRPSQQFLFRISAYFDVFWKQYSKGFQLLKIHVDIAISWSISLYITST